MPRRSLSVNLAAQLSASKPRNPALRKLTPTDSISHCQTAINYIHAPGVVEAVNDRVVIKPENHNSFARLKL